MANQPGVKSVMVEFNRLGVSGGSLQQGTRYIRTAGYDVPACEIEVGLSYRDFVRSFYALRYQGTGALAADTALKTLETEATRMLRDLPDSADGTTQIDLVTSAAELWAFPFEAYAGTKRGVVLTRRIRGNFGDHVAWPAVPKVLFAHAAITSDLNKELVDEHLAALRQALRPWSGGADPSRDLLVVEHLYSIENLEKALAGKFTHVHLLAHGIPVPSPDGPPFTDWGMRLGQAGTAGVHPSRIAAALAPRNGSPVAVTIASCDSANQVDGAGAASWSLAQELHRAGVPVVVASQLPLTMHGSVLLAKHFYEPLLRGDDVRNALDDVRTALREDEKAGHDWLSLVAYVRLPENYDEHRCKVALRMELAMLRTAQKRADEVIRQNDLAALNDVEHLIRDRITSLDAHLRALQDEKDEKDRLECQGLLASAHKRLAELLFMAGRNPAEQRQALETSLQNYSKAFQSNPRMHWQGVQQLALQAVLHGAFDPIDYVIVMRGAKLSADNDKTDYWPLGTIAELYLLAAFAGQQPNPDDARAAVELFKQRAAGKNDDIDSTRRQLRRYADWWTTANGFKTNLGQQAADLAALLT